MNYKGKIAAIAAACLLGAGGLGNLSAFASERPEYLKSVTYFGDEWPINYWNSEDKDIEENLGKIAADGFNSIILVIPWREFQPNSLEGYFNETAFKRLDEVMACAERHGLGVVLRIGYTWDYLGEVELPSRFGGVTQKGGEDWNAWMDYSRRLYQTASAHSNFCGGFITWEDFWDYTANMSRDLTMTSRIRMAASSGYQEYLREHYSLEEVRALYGKGVESFEDVYLPYGDHPSAKFFYEFYDRFLLDFLTATQQVFPGLSMEVRADGDRIYDNHGTYSYYSHSSTYPCGSAEYSALMYSVSMGQQNQGDKISAGEALQFMAENLKGIYEKAGKPLYIEQLLYMDSTEAYSYNTQIEDSQVDTFVRSLSPVLGQMTNGYGLWVYRNYVNNCVYNSQFGLGTDGWEFSGNSAVVEHNGTSMAVLGSNGAISQKLTGRLPSSSKVYVEFYAEPDKKESSVTVRIGSVEKKLRVTGARTYKLEFPGQLGQDITVTVGSKTYLDDVRVYTYEQNGRIYWRDGTEGDLAAAFRELNRELEPAAVTEPDQLP